MSSAGNEELGFQQMPMGLKVLYTFDKDSEDRCLARHPHIFQIQTLKLAENTTIGLVDIKHCLDAVAKCSPELTDPSADSDYVVYAYDYSEPDTPLVGQGVLSWLLDPSKNDGSNNNQSLSMVTGMVTENRMRLLSGNGIKDTLEVKLKFVRNNKIRRPGQQPTSNQQQHSPSPLQSFDIQNMAQTHAPAQAQDQRQAAPHHLQLQTSQFDMSMPQGMDTAQTSSMEWNYLMQSFPPLGHDASVGSPLPLDDVSFNANSLNNIPPAPSTNEPVAQAPPARASSRAPSRPSSRASRKRQPTGRPRGRPRKRPLATEGNTSGYEDGTDGDDGPAPKKRIASTVVGDRAVSAPFAGAPDSLRVAASTSNSLRNFRPLAGGGEGGPSAGSHLQDVPRAPTPVPKADQRIQGARGGSAGSRRPSTLSREPSTLAPGQQSFCDSRLALSPTGEDGHSPPIAATPAAFSDDSGAEISSSPPVPRPSRFLQSSPPPSSPILPPMPQPDSGFMSGSIEESAQFEEPKLHDGCPAEALPSDGMLINAATCPEAYEQSVAAQKNRDVGKVPVQVFRLQDNGGGGMVQIPSPYCTRSGSDKQSAPRQRSKSGRRSSQPAAKPAPALTAAADSHKAKSSGKVKEATQITADVPPQTEQPAERSQSLAPTQAPTPIPLPLPLPEGAPTALDSTPTPAEPVVPSIQSRPPSAPVASMPVARPHNYNRSQSMSALVLPSMPDEPTTTPTVTATPTAPTTEASASTSTSGANGRAAKTAASIPSAPLKRVQTRSSHEMPLPLPLPLPAVPASDTPSAPFLPLPAVPASDPVGPPQQRLPLPSATSFSEAPCPPSDSAAPPPPRTSPPPPRSNKNYVKKQSIRDRLERAVMNGEMPPYCDNCGAIETPTWRKIHTRDIIGFPDYTEYSEKPGHITAIEVTSRDANNKATSYRMVKKALGMSDDKSLWTERLLCNPCGIWLSKNNKHRPAERWEKDHERLGQERRKRGTGRNPVRVRKKANGKDSRSGTAPPPTSEACIPTDDMAPDAVMSPPVDAPPAEEGMGPIPMDRFASLLETANSHEFNGHKVEHVNQTTASGRSGFSNAGSTHTNGTGTVNSPITLDLDEDHLGSTRRILFPSPRHKSGAHRDALNPVSPNIITPSAGDGEGGNRADKELAADVAEALARNENQHNATFEDDLDSLFRSPSGLARPSTPPPKEVSSETRNPFRTPSRPTPSHRPVTRSISRSMRSAQSSPINSQFALAQTTPTRTPMARLMLPESPSLRRSPRINGSAIKNDHDRRMKAIEQIPEGDMDATLNALREAFTPPWAPQEEMQAILNRCLDPWTRAFNEEVEEEWNFELLGGCEPEKAEEPEEPEEPEE
ncbi:hypothetical protein SAPIO_CDS4058 [Scedosporium apiospermum]|uniref:Ams2/SPT21 N-terminal domain-containing protein n=1 Tax=Pseudallescheria apiosperma TaxID=563466 RepID=A0A084G974_PSEDA|nr:uncharacterized protein SAPIO_CDS4058 [Scedosporium apiospermum]KEZ43886.1 hypothetical protein SAPIO_CDS4058 [Scedosporium apiospermum]